MARLCHELQVDFEVALFNRGFAARPDDTEWSYTRTSSQAAAGLRQSHGTAANRLTTTINHYLVKPFDRRWREAEDVLAGMFWTAAEPGQAAIAARRSPRTAPPVSMFERAANVDEFNLIHAAERMARLGANVRVLVVSGRRDDPGVGRGPGDFGPGGRALRHDGARHRHRRRHRHRHLSPFRGGQPPRGAHQGDDRGHPRSPPEGSGPVGHGHLVAATDTSRKRHSMEGIAQCLRTHQQPKPERP